MSLHGAFWGNYRLVWKPQATAVSIESIFILCAAWEDHGKLRSMHQTVSNAWNLVHKETARTGSWPGYMWWWARVNNRSRKLQVHTSPVKPNYCTTPKTETISCSIYFPQRMQSPLTLLDWVKKSHQWIKDEDSDPDENCVDPCLKFALQGHSGTVSAALVHHHHHVGQGVHPHLLHLQVLLQELHSRSTPQWALMMVS